MELSPYISLSPIPHCLAFIPLFFLFFFLLTRTNNKSTLASTYGADELVHTVLCNAVHMREMLLKVNEGELHLAQRALDSLRGERGKTWQMVNKVSVHRADVEEACGFCPGECQLFVLIVSVDN